MAFNKDFSTFFLTQPDEEDFQVSYTGSEDGFTCSHCNTSYEKDLQLAAELGKTLLERNKELETSLKHHQNLFEDQVQEIEYLTKQTTALKEVNNSRLRIYEQLEVSIQDLERNNQRLLCEHSTDKKTIKNQVATIESLENRCDELQLSLNELNVELEKEKRRQHQQNIGERTPSNQSKQDEEISALLKELQEMKAQKTRDLRRITDLEENISNVLQENACLEERLASISEREQDLKTMQEELSTLEDIRQGHLCRRCLRIADDRSLLGGEDDDDVSLIESLISEVDHRFIISQLQESLASADSDNPYKILVQKYEELVRAQRKIQSNQSGQPLSLQEELEMSGLGGGGGGIQSSEPISSSSGYHGSGPLSLQESGPRSLLDNGPLSLQEELDMHSSNTANQKQKASKKNSRDFCESDTSSSGFSDDTSNKTTQTELKYLPGAFLCTISDGDDCKFSIYDDASPVESRFRKTPEYRQLFREIFDVLKRAAEAKEEGEKLPLLDDTMNSVLNETITNISDTLYNHHQHQHHEKELRVPPGTPAKEELPLLKLIEQHKLNNSIKEELQIEEELKTPTTTDNNSLDFNEIEKDIDGNQNDKQLNENKMDGDNTNTLKPNKRSRSRKKKQQNKNDNIENENKNNDDDELVKEKMNETLKPISRDVSSIRSRDISLARSEISDCSSINDNVSINENDDMDEKTITETTVLKPKRKDIFEDIIDGLNKTKRKSKRHSRLLDERVNTSSPPALVGINCVYVSNKILRKRRGNNSNDRSNNSRTQTPDRVYSEQQQNKIGFNNSSNTSRTPTPDRVNNEQQHKIGFNNSSNTSRTYYNSKYDQHQQQQSTSSSTSFTNEHQIPTTTTTSTGYSASQEVAKLKILEKSYAEVLKNNRHHHHNQRNRTAYHRKFN